MTSRTAKTIIFFIFVFFFACFSLLYSFLSMMVFAVLSSFGLLRSGLSSLMARLRILSSMPVSAAMSSSILISSKSPSSWTAALSRLLAELSVMPRAGLPAGFLLMPPPGSSSFLRPLGSAGLLPGI